MTLEEVKEYIKENGLDSKSRKRPLVDERMYLYAYLFYFLELDNLTAIGKMFGGKDHATIRYMLIEASERQFDPEFMRNTKCLNTIIPIEIPEYQYNKAGRRTDTPDGRGGKNKYGTAIDFPKEVYFEFLRKQDPEVIMEFMLNSMIDAAVNRRKQISNRKRKAKVNGKGK